MYTQANCATTDWEHTSLLSKYVILNPECMPIRDEEHQLVKVRGGSGCSVYSTGAIIEVEEVRNDPRVYELDRYDNPIIGIANAATIEAHKQRYGG